MAVAAGVAYGFIHTQIFIPGDGGTTAQNMGALRWMFIIEIILWNSIAALDVVVSFGLYQLVDIPLQTCHQFRP